MTSSKTKSIFYGWTFENRRRLTQAIIGRLEKGSN